MRDPRIALNSEDNKKILAARCELMNRVGWLNSSRLIVDTLLALFAIAAIVILRSTWISWLALPSALWLIVDHLLFQPLENNLTVKATSLQEMFDTRVFSLPWNDMLPTVQVTPEETVALSKRFRSRYGDKKLTDWYPLSDKIIPPHFQHLLGQRCVFEWDNLQRKTFAFILIVANTIILAVAVGIALIINQDVRSLVFGLVVPLTPLVARLAEVSAANLEVARRKHETAQRITLVVKNHMRAAKSHHELLSRSVQDVAFFLRIQAGWIPNWIYEMLYPNYAENSKYAVANLVKRSWR